jgi:hypothetical protein
MNCVEMTPLPSIGVPFTVPSLVYVLKRWAMFPKTSVISAVSISWKLVNTPESTRCCREAMNWSTVETSRAEEVFLLSLPPSTNGGVHAHVADADQI